MQRVGIICRSLTLYGDLIQALLAVILTIFVFATTILFLGPENRPAPINDFIESPPWQPYWTTEQLEPKFAYAQYATSVDYLCNAVINFGRLRRYGAKEDLVLIHPKGWLEGSSREAKALVKLKEERPEIHMRAFDVISTTKGDATWRESLTKFHAFALTEWTRVLAFDSDALVLNKMDHYFLSPAAPVAVPRAYWLNERSTDIAKQVLGSHVMLIEPNAGRYKKIMRLWMRLCDPETSTWRLSITCSRTQQ
ncbi:Glucose N-acetyltransferase 1 [Colletotrichum viniferum]|nr:Glucose N-acetyltransferase 1 [Colletotrichum viniferum]